MTGAEFRSIRWELGLYQVQLADVLGVTSRSVAHWEAGSRPIPGPVALCMTLLREKAQS